MEIVRANLPYKQYYCEENIWKFCEYCKNHDVMVVFVSNDDEKVPLWCQKSSQDGFVIWDYHVFAVCNGKVYDFDTKLEFPCSFETYFNESIKFDDDLKFEYHRKFRLLPGKQYLKHFCSDRRHMLDAESGLYTKEPPPWPAIMHEGKINNLHEFRRMINNDTLIDKISNILDTRQFYEYFMKS